ncbi:hypothetical protein Tco_0952832 [Tanacetum coccineum]|uniref:Uncharacterized protein n=1 Tax=Tanacetum coccineum TaxID=301880 RepID=A0ABQ5E0F9_9ASTR
MIPTSSSPEVVERTTEVTKDTVFPTNNENTKDVHPPVVPVENQILVSEPVVALEVDIIKKTEQSKMTKLSMDWNDCATSRPKSKMSIVRVNILKDQPVKQEPTGQNTVECIT